MKITKIAITGGPCAGKTTGLSFIEREFTKIGYKVIIINESATELILGGFGANAFNDNYKFEKNILGLQLEKEKYYYEACKKLPDEKVLLVCDRGAMDCKPYLTEQEFAKQLEELNVSEVEVRDSYEAVFHLVTAAKGAEDFYSKDNNKARREDLNQAITMDDKTIESWTGHPHLRIIDNSTNFEGKLKRLVKEICICLGEPEPMEIERKFLIEKPDINYLKGLKNCKDVDIMQTYLTSQDETRVRQRGKDGSYIYTITTKKYISPTKRVEFERRISEKEYLTYLTMADTSIRQIRKKRFCLVYKNRYFEIDIYPFANNRAICEIELAEENEQIEMPKFIKVIKEVSDDKNYSNHSFAKSIPSDMY